MQDVLDMQREYYAVEKPRREAFSISSCGPAVEAANRSIRRNAIAYLVVMLVMTVVYFAAWNHYQMSQINKRLQGIEYEKIAEDPIRRRVDAFQRILRESSKRGAQ